MLCAQHSGGKLSEGMLSGAHPAALCAVAAPREPQAARQAPPRPLNPTGHLAAARAPPHPPPTTCLPPAQDSTLQNNAVLATPSKPTLTTRRRPEELQLGTPAPPAKHTLPLPSCQPKGERSAPEAGAQVQHGTPDKPWSLRAQFLYTHTGRTQLSSPRSEKPGGQTRGQGSRSAHTGAQAASVGSTDTPPLQGLRPSPLPIAAPLGRPCSPAELLVSHQEQRGLKGLKQKQRK